MKISLAAIPAAFLLLAANSFSVQARPATCFASGMGKYDCEVNLVEFNGSFSMSAPGKPTFMLIFDAPGYAFGFISENDKMRALPGPFEQEAAEPACWQNLQDDSRLCAW